MSRARAVERMGQALDYLPRLVLAGRTAAVRVCPTVAFQLVSLAPWHLPPLGPDTPYAALAVLIEGSEE